MTDLLSLLCLLFIYPGDLRVSQHSLKHFAGFLPDLVSVNYLLRAFLGFHLFYDHYQHHGVI